MKIVLALVVAAAGFCQAAPPKQETRPVEARLLADAARVRPGQTFTAGVLLEMKPEWHVYWKNPGEAGLPVEIKLAGPDGAAVGAMRWPVPVSFEQPGEIAGYGYTDAVLFPIEVTAPAGASPGSSLELAAEVTWLACKDVCIPGRATVDLTVPVAGEAAPANAGLFASWRDRMPAAAGAGDVAGVAVEGGLAPGASRGTVSIALDWKRPPASVEFFPGADPALAVERVRIATEGGRTKVVFDAEVFEGQSLASETLDSLVVYVDATGARRGVEIPVGLRAQEKKGAAQ